MSRDRKIVIFGHIIWTALLVWTAASPSGTFPNSIQPFIGPFPWIFLWQLVIAALWFVMLPALLRDSRIPGEND
jgi:hypothetical protein